MNPKTQWEQVYATGKSADRERADPEEGQEEVRQLRSLDAHP